MKPSKHKKLPPIDTILSIYTLDPNAGALIHRAARRRTATRKTVSRSRMRLVNGENFLESRLIYLLHYGVDPGEFVVDHINHDPTDNRPSNLRLATYAENTRNTKGARRDSSTGVRGVRWRARDQYFYAAIRVNGFSLHVGCFKNLDEARAAVSAARAKHFGQFQGGD